MIHADKSPFKQQDYSTLGENTHSKFCNSKLNQLWSEVKFIGKSIKRRSYHSSVSYKQDLYVYGGYDINSGIMADFHKINITGNPTWVELTTNTKLYPGPRHGHSAVVFGNKMYLLGGKINSLTSTNILSVYDFEAEIWIQVNTSGQQIPCIDSHSAAIYEQKMYVFGGFISGTQGLYSNTLYVLDLDKLSWSKINTSGKCPQPRANSSITILNDSLFMFGGSNLDQKFRDLWKFDLTTNKWELIDTKQQQQMIPDKRAGHTLTAFKNSILLFGGIQNITHEKDDVFIFDITTNLWKQIDKNESADQCLNLDQNCKDQNQLPVSTKQIGDSKMMSLKIKKSMNNKSSLDPFGKSLQKQQKSQQISKHEIRKQQLLSEFELTPEQNQKYRTPSPTIQSLKSSILSINPLNKKKNADQQVSKQVIKKNIKKKPCARDGHTANLFNNKIIFLGGDRHMMSFNDMYLLSLDTLN